MIMVDGKKMAKSEGNFVTIKDALKSVSGNALRLFILNTHYRMPLNYTNEGILAAQKGINRLLEAIENYESLNGNISETNEFINEFTESMTDDFNSPQALSVLFKITDLINLEKNKNKRHELQNILIYLSGILGLNLQIEGLSPNFIRKNVLDKLIDNLIIWRTDSREKKDYVSSDKIRDILNNCKIEVKDLPGNKYKWQIKL